MSRLDELAIFHIAVHPMMESTSEMPFKTHIMWKWIDGEWRESPQIVPFECVYISSRPNRYFRNLGDKPGRFTRAETFRADEQNYGVLAQPWQTYKMVQSCAGRRGIYGRRNVRKSAETPRQLDRTHVHRRCRTA